MNSGTPEIERAPAEQARRQGTTPEQLALAILREQMTPSPSPPSALPEPRGDWERQLLELGTDCGGSLSNEAVSSEGLYD